MGSAVTESAIEVAERYFGALAARDVEGMAACWHRDGVDVLHGMEELHGPEGVRQYFQTLLAAFPDIQFEVTGMHPAGDVVTVQWRATGTFGGGPFMGFEPTGARVAVEGCDVVRAQDGLLIRNDAYFDGADMARQMGLMPAQGSKGEQRLAAIANRGTRLRLRAASAAPEQIADGVHVLRGGLLRTMNVYLIEHGDKVTVFDAGEKGMAPAVLSAAAKLGGIERVVLGHADNDHRGSAPALGAPVFCHELEVAAAEQGGWRDYWRTDQLPRAVRTLHKFSMDHIWDGGPVQIAGTLAEGDEVAGFRVIALPGHAPGQIGLWREADGVALVSDCFYMTTMWGLPQDPAVPLDAYNHDTAQARESIRKLAALEPRIAAPGHLGPLTEDVAGHLRRAAEA